VHAGEPGICGAVDYDKFISLRGAMTAAYERRSFVSDDEFVSERDHSQH
jgi:hypothetical protein